MKKKITGGVYVVVDPALEESGLLSKLQAAMRGGIKAVQIWNNWSSGQDKLFVIDRICKLARGNNIPVLINEEWQLLSITELDGVHFDAPPQNLASIRQQVNKAFLCGITCGNNLDTVAWARDNDLDYISFCSMFPSASAGACEIVSKETVKRARAITHLPIFLAGGITPENAPELSDTSMDGIAVISAIMKADNPEVVARSFQNILTKQSHEKISR